MYLYLYLRYISKVSVATLPNSLIPKPGDIWGCPRFYTEKQSLTAEKWQP